MTRICLGLVLLGIPAVLLPAQVREEPFGRAPQEWCRDVDYRPQETVCEVREETLTGLTELDADTGGNGGISVRGWDRPDVALRLRLRARARTAEDARRVASTVTITTAGGRIRADGPQIRNNESWDVSLELQVPRALRLALATANGGIALRDFGGTAELRTANGGLALADVGGDIRGRTVNGGISVALSGRRWDGAGLDLQGTNGGIQLAVPANYNAEVDLRTFNGGVRVDVPLTAQRSMSRTRITGRVGSGGPLLRLQTLNGGVMVRRR